MCIYQEFLSRFLLNESSCIPAVNFVLWEYSVLLVSFLSLICPSISKIVNLLQFVTNFVHNNIIDEIFFHFFFLSEVVLVLSNAVTFPWLLLQFDRFF